MKAKYPNFHCTNIAVLVERPGLTPLIADHLQSAARICGIIAAEGPVEQREAAAVEPHACAIWAIAVLNA